MTAIYFQPGGSTTKPCARPSSKIATHTAPEPESVPTSQTSTPSSVVSIGVAVGSAPRPEASRFPSGQW